MIIIAFNGLKGSGKDVAADYLVENNGFIKFSFAKPLKEIAEKYYGWNGLKDEKNRQILCDIAKHMRDVDDNIFVNALNKRIVESNHKKIVISDMRFINEINYLIDKRLKENVNTYFAKIIRPIREIDRLDEDISETQLKHYPFEHIIYNDGSIEEFENRVEEWLKNIEKPDSLVHS